MPLFTIAFKKAVIKNIWVILGIACLGTAWLIEKKSINTRQDEIDSKRLFWDQYRVDNYMYSQTNSKFETMRLIDIATSSLPKDSSAKAQILLQLRFALFDHLRLRIEREEALYLLEKDPLDTATAHMLYNKRVEATKAFNSKDINQMYTLHERDNDESFNSSEEKTKHYVREFYNLLEKHEKAESRYFILYILGSILIVFQKIKDTIRQEKVSLGVQKPLTNSRKKK